MSDNNYNVQIVAQRYDSATVAKLAALFKKSEGQIKAALEKGNIIAKSRVDEASAAKYKKAIEQKTGVLCIIAAPNLPLYDYPETIKPTATKAHPHTAKVEQPPRRKLAVIVASIALGAALLTALVAYHIWTSSPDYSLMQIRHAVNDRDLALFRKHVDYENLIARGLEATTARELDKVGPADNLWKALGNQIGEGIAGLMIPALSKKLAGDLENAVAQGRVADLGSRLRLDAVIASLQGAANESARATSEQAYARAPLEHPAFGNKRFTLIFSMREMDGYWQIVELSNLTDYLDWQAEQKAYYLTEANKPILAAIDASIEAVSFSHKRLPANPFRGPELQVTMNFTNAGSKAIKTLYCDITISRLDNGELLSEQSLSWGNGTLLLASDGRAELTKELSSFTSPALEHYLGTPDTDLKIDYQISSISFADGSELALYREFGKLP